MREYEGKLDFAQSNSEGWWRESDAQELVCFVEVRCRSFSLPKVSKKCSHLIHNCSLSAPPAGLEIRNRR